MNYKHIIWDWNGTLIDDVQLCVDVLNSLLVRRGMTTLDVARYREIFDFPVIDFYRDIGFDFETESYLDVADEYISNYTSRLGRCSLCKGAPEALETLSAQGITHSVLSAYQQDLLVRAVEQFGLQSVFIELNGLNDYSASSKVENGKEWIAKLHYRPQQVLLVGDTVHDYEVAMAMGVDCVLLACGHQSRAKLAATGTTVLDSPADLPKMLD